MEVFTYKAKDKSGKLVSGSVTASNLKAARDQLRNKGMTVRSITSSNASDDHEKEFLIGHTIYRDRHGQIQISLGSKAPSYRDITIFTKQLSVMLGAGVSLITALDILKSQQESIDLELAVRQIKVHVENGIALSQAMAKHPLIFDDLYVALITAGEASGNLDAMLNRLALYLGKTAKIKGQVQSALVYPIIVTVIALAILSGLLAWVVPTFAEQFADTGRELPWLTQQVIAVSDFFLDNWIKLGFCLVGFVFALNYWLQTEKGREAWDRFILKVPAIGTLMKKIAVSRFCSTMADMLSSGVNLLSALSICATSAGNKVFEEFILDVRKSLEAGTTFAAPLSNGDLFPDMVVSMVTVGEATGALDEMLQKISEFFEEEVDLALEAALSLIEPFMIVVIGGLVGIVLIAMYLPVFDLAGGF